MKYRLRSRPLLLAAVAALALGCSSGAEGDGEDAGQQVDPIDPQDAATGTPADAGPIATVDSGPAAEPDAGMAEADAGMVEFTLTSPEFEDGGEIPLEPFTCGRGSYPSGESPALAFEGVPEGTVGLVLLMDDQTFGGFRHWGVYNIPAETTGVAQDSEPDGASVAEPYAGPCPPTGTGEHTYRFRLFALTEALSLPSRPSFDALRRAVESQDPPTATLYGRVSYEALAALRSE